MPVRQTIDLLERDYLRAVYEMSGRQAKSAVSYWDVSAELGCSEDDAERFCGHWVDRGMLEWVAFGHIALTHVGLRRAERMARRGWLSAPF
jgi:Mn-dependent DtxR family transcriptional regulator